MSVLFGWIFFLTFIAFIIYWRKKAKAQKMAGENYQNDPFYQQTSKTKRIIGIVCVLSLILAGATSPKPSPEEEAKIEAEKQAATEKAAQEQAEQAAKEKADQEQKVAARIEHLTPEEKAVFDEKMQEYIKNSDDSSAKAKALDDVDAYITQKQEAEKAAQAKAQEEADRQAKLEEERQQKRKGLEKLEKEGKIKYYDLGNNTFDVVITERATFKYDTNGLKNLANFAIQDEHERNIISTSAQCMKLVQTIKDAEVNVNNFTINLTGDTVDFEGYKSVGNVVICEIKGNRNFKKDDPYSFYNSTDRYWMINGL